MSIDDDQDDDDDDDFAADDDWPEGVYHDEEWLTVQCRHCRAEIAEGSERCPRCEMYQSGEDGRNPPKSRFWWVMMVLALIISALWAVFR